MSDFPRLAVETGRYAAEWVVEDRRIPGEVEFHADRPSRLVFFDEVKPIVWESEGGSRRAGMPQDHTMERIVGRLRTGHDVVVTGAAVQVWFMERSSGWGQRAAVGMGIADVADEGWTSVRMQVTGAELLFGRAPIKSYSFPKFEDPLAPRVYGVELDPESDYHWDDHELGLVADCSYEGSFSLSNPFRHEMAFAPVLELQGPATSVEAWMVDWVDPLVGLVTLATRVKQRLSWLTIHATRRGEERRSAVIFGSGIDQAPYQADLPKGRRADLGPLFTLGKLPRGLPRLLARWRDLQAEQNPFFELYTAAMSQADLHPRARFLHLMQALEGLHTHEHREVDDVKQASFEEKRAEALTALAVSTLATRTASFIRKNWSKRKPDSLDRRLRELLDEVPSSARPDMAESAARLALENAPTLEQQLRVLRNHLSHGTRNFEGEEITPWVSVLETTCQVHAMRLLGFPAETIEEAFRSE